MSALSDTITLGLVLILLFGSICLYLYTRIQQAEQKLSLIESILLELKMSCEFKDYPGIETIEQPVPNKCTDNIIEPEHMTLSVNDQFEPFEEPVQTEPHQLFPADQVKCDVDTVLQGNHESQTSVYTEMPQESGMPEMVYEEQPLEVVEINSEPVQQPLEPQQDSAPIHSLVNYESMTLKELREIASQRRISGISNMKRSQVLNTLRAYDQERST